MPMPTEVERDNYQLICEELERQREGNRMLLADYVKLGEERDRMKAREEELVAVIAKAYSKLQDVAYSKITVEVMVAMDTLKTAIAPSDPAGGAENLL